MRFKFLNSELDIRQNILVLSARQALADLCFFEDTSLLSVFVFCLAMPKYLSIIPFILS